MKDSVGYEEFSAAVYEAENEGSENKLLNVEAKAMTVEKIINYKERNDLKDLRQQIELLSTIMKSTTLGSVKPEGWGHGWRECPTLENLNWRKLMVAVVPSTPGSPGSTPTQPQNQDQ